MDKKINGIAWTDEECPHGETVVFIHGFPFNRSMWQPQTKALSDRHRVLSFDVRGHGQSEVGDGQYSLEFFVDDLMAGMDEFKIKTAVLCGLSMGGYIALRAVERHPDRFKALVLCDTKSEADSDEVKIKRAATIRKVKDEGVEAFAGGFVKTVLGEKSAMTKPELIESVLKMIRGNTTLGISGALLALAARTDTTASLSKIKMPTLILVGEEDKLTPLANAEAMRQRIPNSILHVIPEAGHLSNLENPNFFNERLLAFLN